LENTKQNSYIKSKKKGHDLINSFRLPTEAEWEYSARRIRVSNLSLGGPYTKNDRGCFLANFKPNREIMQQIRHCTQLKQKSYEPNGYNLYNMAGNVSEWTDSSYDLT
jgi:formylglycine-generating enzyme required for sulfatase activity